MQMTLDHFFPVKPDDFRNPVTLLKPWLDICWFSSAKNSQIELPIGRDPECCQCHFSVYLLADLHAHVKPNSTGGILGLYLTLDSQQNGSVLFSSTQTHCKTHTTIINFSFSTIHTFVFLSQLVQFPFSPASSNLPPHDFSFSKKQWLSFKLKLAVELTSLLF